MRHRLRNGTIVGLDLSLRAAAACALPYQWDHDLSKVRMIKTGSKLTKDATQHEKIDRMSVISDDIHQFCRDVQARKIWIEDHAYGAGGNNANQTIEMTGGVKLKIYEDWGVVIEPVVASRARKVLLQKLPRADVKAFTYRNVRRLGGFALTWTEDEVDAFVVANYGLMVSGGVALTFLGV